MRWRDRRNGGIPRRLQDKNKNRNSNKKLKLGDYRADCIKEVLQELHLSDVKNNRKNDLNCFLGQSVVAEVSGSEICKTF